MATAREIATRLDAALKAGGHPITGVSIGMAADKATWLAQYLPSATAPQKTACAAAIAAFDPDSASNVDSDLTNTAQATSRQKDVLASIAWAIRFKDPAAWNALTGAQKKAAVLAEADNWRDIRIFIEKNL